MSRKRPMKKPSSIFILRSRQYLLLLVFFSLLGCRTSQSGNSEIEQAIASLYSDDIAERERGSATLSRLGVLAVARLKELASTSDPEIAGRAKYLIRRIEISGHLSKGIRIRVPEIVDSLTNSDDSATTKSFLLLTSSWKDADSGACILGKDLECLVLPAWRGALSEDDQIGVCRAIGKWRLQGCGGVLADALTSPYSRVRSAAAIASGCTRATETLPQLLRIASSDDAARVDALRALEAMEHPDCAELARGALTNINPAVRAAAVGVLVGLLGPKSTDLVVPFLTDPDSLVRRVTVMALSPIHSPESRRALLPLLADSDSEVRMLALEDLGMSGDVSLIPSLVSQLDKKENRASVITALAQLKTPNFENYLRECLVSEDAFVRGAAIRALSNYEGFQPDLPTLRELLCHESAVVRIASLEAVTRQGVRGLDGLVLNMTNDENPLVRKASIEYLSQYGDGPVGRLERLLADSDSRVRVAIARAMLLTNPRKSIRILLRDSDDLSVLNSLRRPDLWSELQRRISIQISGRPMNEMRAIVERLHFRLEWNDSSWDTDRWTRVSRRPQYIQGSSIEAIKIVLDGRRGFVMDDNVIRVLPPDEEWCFWKCWIMDMGY